MCFLSLVTSSFLSVVPGWKDFVILVKEFLGFWFFAAQSKTSSKENAHAEPWGTCPFSMRMKDIACPVFYRKDSLFVQRVRP